jgi:hypothetical protein
MASLESQMSHLQKQMLRLARLEEDDAGTKPRASRLTASRSTASPHDTAPSRDTRLPPSKANLDELAGIVRKVLDDASLTKDSLSDFTESLAGVRNSSLNKAEVVAKAREHVDDCASKTRLYKAYKTLDKSPRTGRA